MPPAKDIFKREFIGLQARIVMSTHPPLVGVHGKIIDETKNMLILRTPNGYKKIPKTTSVFLITFPDGKEVKVDGIKIVGRPEDRIRKCR